MWEQLTIFFNNFFIETTDQINIMERMESSFYREVTTEAWNEVVDLRNIARFVLILDRQHICV